MYNDLLKKLQNTELEILLFIHDFCLKHNIQYALYAGTALGAVRHKGFIPWDDDVDIYMERKEYEKFKVCWRNEEPKEYYFQVPETSDEPINHSKIRKKGTSFISDGAIEKGDPYDGIWVDIFVFDKVKATKMGELYMKFWGGLSVLFKRPYPDERNGKSVYFITKSVTSLPQKIRDAIENIAINKTQRYKNLIDSYKYVCICTWSDSRRFFEKGEIEGYQNIEFCNHNLRINTEHKKLLECYYGDYMTLPPIEDQICKHRPRKLVF